MKTTAILLLVLLLLVSGCSTTTSSNLPPESIPSEISGEISDGSKEPPPAQEDAKTIKPERPFNLEAEKYYDYFMANVHVSMLLGDKQENTGFSDSEMAAYVLCQLIVENAGNYEQDVGFPKEEFDAVTRKYFGTTVQKYENQKSTVIPGTGNITATGWGGSLVALVLKELEIGSDGTRTGIFYQFSFSMDGLPPSAKADLLQGFFEDYGQPYLVQIVFTEQTDSNGELYLRYIDLQSLGEAAPPYTLYQG